MAHSGHLSEPPVDMKVLHTKIGQQALEIDFFRRRAHQSGHAERNDMNDPEHKLPITRQAKLVYISRGSVYYLPVPTSAASSPASPSPTFSKRQESRSAWMARGSWRDNVFVERLWRSVKYEEVYLKCYDSVSQARESIERYLQRYNNFRPHSSLDRMTPDETYFNIRPLKLAA